MATLAGEREAEAALDEFVARLRALSSKEDVERALSPLDPEFLHAVLDRLAVSLGNEEREALRRVAVDLEDSRRPSTPDELWRFVAQECGHRIPRKAVCRGHDAPFDFMCSVYFGSGDKLAVGNRGSGKTQIMGDVHSVNARTKPGFTAATVGAVEAQAKRCYGFFRQQVTKAGAWARTVVGKPLMAGTDTRGGGRVEIVTGTVSGVNSPHPALAHLDEVELLRPGVYEEALNMAQSILDEEGNVRYPAANVLTSSWKKPKGLVTQLIDDAEAAARDGRRPMYEVFRWCVWETTAPCPHDCSACPFSDAVKGTWGRDGEEAEPRTFESACKRGSPGEADGLGKLKFTDGFVPVEDAVGRFVKLSRRVWESQQESKRPTAEGLVYDCWDPDRHELSGWDPDPELGEITVGLDFGGTSPHSALFWQELRVDVDFTHPDGTVERIRQGTDVLFDEVYRAGIGNVEFGRLVNEKIERWKAQYQEFKVAAFYRDPAAAAAALDLATMQSVSAPGDDLARNIITRAAPKDTRDSRVGTVYERIENGWVRADIRCEGFLDELGGYEESPVTGLPRKRDDHAMDAMAYRFAGVHGSRRAPPASAAPVSRNVDPRERPDEGFAVRGMPGRTGVSAPPAFSAARGFRRV